MKSLLQTWFPTLSPNSLDCHASTSPTCFSSWVKSLKWSRLRENHSCPLRLRPLFTSYHSIQWGQYKYIQSMGEIWKLYWHCPCGTKTTSTFTHYLKFSVLSMNATALNVTESGSWHHTTVSFPKCSVILHVRLSIILHSVSWAFKSWSSSQGSLWYRLLEQSWLEDTRRNKEVRASIHDHDHDSPSAMLHHMGRTCLPFQ